MQTDYGAAPAAIAGLIADIGPKSVITRNNATRKLYEVTAGTTDGTYTISVNGTEKANFAAVSKTAAQIIADLLADLQAAAGHGSTYLAMAGSTTAKLLVEQYGYDVATAFAVTISTVSGYSVNNVLPQGQTIPFGVGVVRDENAALTGRQCRLPRVAGDIAAGLFLGISVADTSREPQSGVGYEHQSAVPILEFGNIWVNVEDTVTEGQNLFCRYASGAGGSQLGAFRPDADSSSAAAVPGLYTRQARTGAGLVLCRYAP